MAGRRSARSVGSVPGSRPLLPALVLAALALAAPPAQGARLATLAGTVPGSLPTRAQGETDIVVLSLSDGRVAAARTLTRSGRFSLRLPAGGYAVRTSIIDRRARTPSTAALAVSLRAGQRRTKVALKVRRRPVRRSTSGRAAFVQESGKTSQGTAVSIEPFTGATGEWSVLNRGLADMLITDVAQQIERCKGVVAANSRDRELLKDELDLQQSPAFDPSTRVKRDWVQSDVVVTGTLSNRGDGVDVTLTLTDARSGESLGTISGRVSGSDWPADEERLAKSLSKKLCRQPEAYQVSLSAQATGDFVVYKATGTAEGLVLARAQDGDEDTAPTRWQSEPSEIGWKGVTFASGGVAPCTWVQASTEGQWRVTIAAAGPGMVTVTTEGLPGAKVIANAFCPPSPAAIPGQGGPALAGLAPEQFQFPAGGGTKAIAGSLVAWSHTGTITLRPSAPPG